MAKDEEITVKKRSKAAPSSRGPSLQMRRLMLGTRVVGIFLGGFVTTVALMSVVGVATDNFLVRLVVGLVIVVGVPLFVADRLLKRTNLGGGLVMIVDMFAIVLLGIALVVLAMDPISKPLFTHEGDRYARTGSTTMARVVYWMAGDAPVFPSEKPAAKPGGSASASASASGGK